MYQLQISDLCADKSSRNVISRCGIFKRKNKRNMFNYGQCRFCDSVDFVNNVVAYYTMSGTPISSWCCLQCFNELQCRINAVDTAIYLAYCMLKCNVNADVARLIIRHYYFPLQWHQTEDPQ